MPQSNGTKPAAPKAGGAKTTRSARDAGTGSQNKGPRGKKTQGKTPRRREIAAAVCFVLAVFSFIGYWSADGVFIGFFAGLAKGLVGSGFFAVCPALLWCAVILCFHRGRPVKFRVVCTLLLTVALGSLVHSLACRLEYEISFAMLSKLWRDGKSLEAGGAVSGSFAVVFTWLFSKVGAVIVFICLTLFLLLSALNKTIAGFVDAYRNRERLEYIPEPEPERAPEPVRTQGKNFLRDSAQPKKRKVIDIPLDDEADEARDDEPDSAPQKPRENFFKSTPRVKTPDQLVSEYAPAPEERTDDEPAGSDDAQETEAETPEEPAVPAEAEAEAEAVKAEEIEDIPLDIPFMETRRGRRAGQTDAKGPAALSDEPPPPGSEKEDAPEPIKPQEHEPEQTYVYPPLNLLSAGAPGARVDGSDEIRVNSERLETAFRSFGVNVGISNATRGPSVTRYEAELEAGVKLNKLTNLADDIALSLGKSGVRIAAMPNKISTVGIEVPNKNISTVYLRDIIESAEFSRAESKLTFAIGMDISGEAIVGSISKLPHMLVAGTTGSGKSVCLNSIILSILYKARPDEVRFIMIDPKMVEFKVYNDIPHLLVPVVTDVKKASGALQWAVVEMMKRYKLFSETNERDLEGYNRFAATSDEHEYLPQIVVVIDELADLMMMAAKEVEESICRVAQMGRAAGIHLIIATQSPRADVITGLMKANIPSRIALKVSSALESRIILDAGGNADKLVGNGDMLYAPIGTSKPMRVQGSWVSDKERENVVEFIKNSGESQYSEKVMGEIEKAAAEKPSGDKPKDEPDVSDYDELLPQAVDVIFETGQASVSMLQRRLKLGYSRAARIVDQMEQMGIVGQFEGSKPRALLVTKDQWRQMQYLSGVAPADTIFPDPVVSVSEEDD